MVDDDAVVNGGGRIGRSAKLDDAGRLMGGAEASRAKTESTVGGGALGRR